MSLKGTLCPQSPLHSACFAPPHLFCKVFLDAGPGMAEPAGHRLKTFETQSQGESVPCFPRVVYTVRKSNSQPLELALSPGFIRKPASSCCCLTLAPSLKLPGLPLLSLAGRLGSLLQASPRMKSLTSPPRWHCQYSKSPQLRLGPPQPAQWHVRKPQGQRKADRRWRPTVLPLAKSPRDSTSS